MAHYREPVFRELCVADDKSIEYVLISGMHSNIKSLITIDPKKASIPLNKGGLNWRFVNNYWLTKALLWQSGLIKLAWNQEFDGIIFLGNAYYLSTWTSIIVAKLRGKKTLMWTHGFLRSEKGLKDWLRSMFYKLPDALLLYGNRAKNILIDKGFPANSIYVINNSLNYSVQRNIRETLTEDKIEEYRNKNFKHADWPILIATGRLTDYKKIDYVVQAAIKLKNKGRDVNVLIVGDGPCKVKIKKLIEEGNIHDRVVLYGECYDENILGPLISMSDICVIPGAIGLTCMHSLVYGTPVITNNRLDYQNPEVEAIKVGINGDLYEYGKIDDLVNKIDRWLKQDKSKNEIKKSCQLVIDKYYTPKYQKTMIEKAVNSLFT
jgi:glycosyltransferase involved in cell wall biosynthesis